MTRRQWIIGNSLFRVSSETNQRYNYGDPTMDSFRFQQGWIHALDRVDYKTYFTVIDEAKERMMVQAKEIFAAGVPVPGDLSKLWAEKQRSRRTWML